MDHSIKNRDSSLDIIRLTACFLVICVHCLSYNGFYRIRMGGITMYLLCLARGLFMTCVPLFLLLTGYLMNHKQLSKDYYKGILHTLCTYVLVSLVCAVFSVIHQGNRYTLVQFLLGFTEFQHAPYSWYIRMYIGLFLIIPFLNLIYHNLPGKKQKQWLIFSCLLLTSIPPVINMFNLRDSHSLYQVLRLDGFSEILPDYWLDLYPLTYYFIGCYLSEFRPRVRVRFLLPTLGIYTIVTGTFVFLRNWKSYFAWNAWLEWGSLFNVITAVLVFMILLQIPTGNWSIPLKKGIRYLSSLALGGYLFSWIFDVLIYTAAVNRIPDMLLRQRWDPLLVLIVFACSLVSAALIDLVSRLIFFSAGKLGTALKTQK